MAGRVSTAMSAAFTGKMAGLGASFGVAVCPRDGDDPAGSSSAPRTRAMYAAKRPGEGFACPAQADYRRTVPRGCARLGSLAEGTGGEERVWTYS